MPVRRYIPWPHVLSERTTADALAAMRQHASKETRMTTEAFTLQVDGNQHLSWTFLGGGNPEARATFIEGRPASAQGSVHVRGGAPGVVIAWENPERMLSDLERVCRGIRERLGIKGSSQ